MSTENQPPSKEEIIAFLTDQIEVKKLQADLQELNTRIATGRAKELESLAYIGQITAEPKESPTLHTLTQEDIDKNPELTEQGLKAGDEVYVAEDKPSKRSLKKEK